MAVMLVCLCAASLATAAQAQSGGYRAGFSGGGFSGRSGGYQPGFGNYGYLGGAAPGVGPGYSSGQGFAGSGRSAGGYEPNGPAFSDPSFSGPASNGSGFNGGDSVLAEQDPGSAIRRGRGDDGVRFGGTGSTDLGHGVHLGDGGTQTLPYGSGSDASGGFVSPAYGNEQWRSNYFPGD